MPSWWSKWCREMKQEWRKWVSPDIDGTLAMSISSSKVCHNLPTRNGPNLGYSPFAVGGRASAKPFSGSFHSFLAGASGYLHGLHVELQQVANRIINHLPSNQPVGSGCYFVLFYIIPLIRLCPISEHFFWDGLLLGLPHAFLHHVHRCLFNAH